jgi:5'(3')-deoxyribonucleotidase
MTSDQKEVKEIQAKWSEIRLYDREEAQQKLSGEWLEAYNRYYQQYDDDMVKMKNIIEDLKSYIQPTRAQKKSKGQKRRDAIARKLA